MKTFEEFLNKYYNNKIFVTEENNMEDEKNNERTENEIKSEETEIEKEDKKGLNKSKNENNKLFFKNILFFTNERRVEKNKTLKNLQDAIKGSDVEIITFVAEEVSFKATDKKIHIEDSKQKYDITTQSNIDTIVIVRLGAQDSEECMECIKELQDWGLFVINPIQSAKKASNKYTSSVLLERYKIPQPKFALLDKNDIENVRKLAEAMLCEFAK